MLEGGGCDGKRGFVGKGGRGVAGMRRGGVGRKRGVNISDCLGFITAPLKPLCLNIFISRYFFFQFASHIFFRSFFLACL